VISPTLQAIRGVARLRSLVERRTIYAEAPLFSGGCYWAANLPNVDSQPGPVRDTLTRHQDDWRKLIADQLRDAADTGGSRLCRVLVDGCADAAMAGGRGKGGDRAASEKGNAQR